jgi:CheY-like chemotaxis protein
LQPSAAEAVAMALHELATNAAKYGALSQKSGHLTVSWRLDGEKLIIDWLERGGPPVATPAKTGFGSKVISASIGDQLGGSVVFKWRPAGLSCTLAVPQDAATLQSAATPAPAEQREAPHHDENASAALEGVRVLVVEDEAIVALMIADLLECEGAVVIGPINKLDHAMRTDESFDVAILDLNLNGVSTYPFAERLQEEGRPFVFATGYDEASIESRFADVLALQKPFEPRALVDAVKGALSRASAAPARMAERV